MFNTPWTYGLAFALTFVFVFLKSFQQLNVVHRKYVWIVPTSLGMAACDIYIITAAASAGLGWIIVPVGLGGGCGSVCATYLHWRLFRQ